MDFAQRNFAGGEVAPGLYGRPDTTKYQTGARTMRNMIARRHGGASNRTGSKYICAQRDSTLRGRLMKFVFNDAQTYVLLFEDATMRVIQNGVLLTVTGTAWSNATAYIIGNVASLLGINYYCILAHTNHTPPNATYWYPMPADGTYEVPTPFTQAELQDLYRSQSGDVITLTHINKPIHDLSRSGNTTWIFTQIAMAPSIALPPTLTNSGAAGNATNWVATAVKAETYEESLISPVSGTSATPSSGAPITLTIGTVSGALEYNVYKNEGAGIYGFIGTSSVGTFVDRGHVPDYDLTPPIARDPFSGSDNRPACSGYIQQRKAYGGATNNPETVYASKTGQYKNFGISSPLRLNDALTYPIASQQVNTVRHILEVLETFILTAGVEWVALGGADGALTPGSPGLKPKSYYGASEVPPVIIGDNMLFIQALGGLVRDMNYDSQAKGYSGRDLSVFAPHLFAGKIIEHWDYAQMPDSIVYAQQDDGGLIGLTYLPEHEVWGWHRHDTYGDYEDVVCIPEGGEHVTYVLVKRTIAGTTKRYVERFVTRVIEDVTVDAIFMDSYLTYDGRNADLTKTLKITTSTDYLAGHNLTLTAAGFTPFTNPGSIGKHYRLRIQSTSWTPEDNDQTVTTDIEVTVTAYTTSTVVTVTALIDVPAVLQNVATSVWALGAITLTGLDHLNEQRLAILADGVVHTNGMDSVNVSPSSGIISLGTPYRFVVHAGLPYCSDLETLDLEVMGGEPQAVKKKHITSVDLVVEASQGFSAGEDQDHLEDWVPQPSDTLPYTGHAEIPIRSTWNKGGRVFVRQKNPLPLTVLNVIPNVSIGG